LKEATGSFLALMATIQSFPIVPKGSLKTGERPPMFPPGTGPFSVGEWKTGQKLVLKKFKDYWQKGIPRVDEITIRAVSDDAVRFTALRTGELDLIEKLPHQHVERIQKGAVKEATLVFASATGFRALIFNTQKPPMDKIKVRQAVAWAIDKEEIMRGAHWGIATVTNQKMVPGSPWYFDVPDRKRDLEKARRLLREAGISGRLKLKIVATTANKEEVPILQKQLDSIGIDLEPEIVDFTTYIDRQHRGEFDLCTIGGLVASDPHANYYAYLHSEPDTQKRVRNLPGYANPTVDKLLEDGRTTTNRKERLRIYREFAEIVQEEVPVIALGFSPFAFAMKPYVKGLEMNPQGRFFSGDMGLPLLWLEK
jgi:peptide/nickel transport system substrate-binding protein